MTKTTNPTAKTRATTKAPAPVEVRKTKKVLTERDLAPGQPTAKELKAKIARELATIAAKEGAPRASAAVAKATAMAKGVNGRTAPQSAKAFSDGSAKATKAAILVDLCAQPAKPAKAGTATRSTWGDDRDYKALVEADECNLREGTWTEHMVLTALAHGNIGKANAAHAKSGKFADKKIDWKWLADVRKYLQF